MRRYFFGRKKKKIRVPSANNQPDKKDARNTQQQVHHAAAGSAVIDAVVGGFFRVRQPAHPTRCFESQRVTHKPLHRCPGCDSLIYGRSTETELHRVKISFLSNGKAIKVSYEDFIRING